MKAEELSTELSGSANELMEQLARFTAESANRKSNPDEWSAAEVGEHLLILETMANRVLRGETIESTRPPDQKLPLIKSVMTDIGTKRIAPVGVLPTGKVKRFEDIKSGLQEQRELLQEITGSEDLSRACVAFKHPGLGTLTMMEWIYFTSLHCRRHAAQLGRIYTGINSPG